MEKATFVSASYEKSSSRKHQGNRNSIQKYLNSGYLVVEERNGFWILNKPSSLTVCLKDKSGKKFFFDMKKDILDYYGKQRMSNNIFDMFLNDAINEKITFYIDDNSYSFK